MLKQLIQSKFVQNVILVAGGTAGAQVISMTFSPIITRIYGPEEFGLLGVFMAVIGTVTPIAALTYPVAIVLPKSDDEAKEIARLSIHIALGMAIVLAAILLLAGNRIADLLDIREVVSFMLLIPLAMFFAALQQIMQQWMIRKKQFKVTARIAISQSFILNSSKVGLGWLWPVGSVLIILATLGNALYAVQLWFGAKRCTNIGLCSDGPPKKILCLKELAHKHRDFPFFRAPQAFLNALSQNLPVLILASYFGSVNAGLYSMAALILGAPVLLLGKSIATVFYPKFNEAYNNKKNTRQILIKAISVLSVIGLMPLVIVIFFGPLLFGVVFGPEWSDAGVYARWMAIWFYFMLITRPVIAAIPVLSLQGFFLLYEVIGLPIRLGSLFLGYYLYGNPLIAVTFFCLVNSLMYCLLTLRILVAAKQPIRQLSL